MRDLFNVSYDREWFMLKKAVMPDGNAPSCSDCKNYMKLQWPVPCLACEMTKDRRYFVKKVD